MTGCVVGAGSAESGRGCTGHSAGIHSSVALSKEIHSAPITPHYPALRVVDSDSSDVNLMELRNTSRWNDSMGLVEAD